MENKTTHKVQYYVDNMWKCECGALNAAHRETCGKCNQENEYIKQT